MRIERKNINEMNTLPTNPRVGLQPGDVAYDSLESSINRFGLVLPVVWNEQSNNVIAGHQRLSVLKQLGIDEVDVSVVSLNDTQEKQLNIALNKITGEWDEALLAELVEEIGEQAITLGFSTEELQAMESGALVDTDFLQDELSQIADTFNLSLRFEIDNKEMVNSYINEYGKDHLVQLIIDMAQGVA